MDNIELIEDFIKRNTSEKIIINTVSEEISFFYLFVLEHLCELHKKKIFYDNLNVTENNDLFEAKGINLFRYPGTKDLKNILMKNESIVIMTDYKNFKKLSTNHLAINGYKFQSDLKLFFNKYLDINDSNLIDYCNQNPHYTCSEVTKYNLNNSETSYEKDKARGNKILEIRKNIYSIKKQNLSLQKLYLMHIEEKIYKKFSFLIY